MNQTNILSLFDGMSCGQLALQKIGFKYDNYFASEVDKHAIKVTQSNFPDTIQLGDVRNIDSNLLPQIYLLQGGSPCQSFSFAGKRKGMSTKTNIEILSLEQYLELKQNNFEFEGQSYLFWEFVRLLNELKPKYFFLENVLMEERWKNVISKTLNVHPIELNSSLFSAQNRRRLYWTNIGTTTNNLFGIHEPGIKTPKDKNILLPDILEKDVDSKYYLSEKALKLLGEKMIEKSINNKKSTTIDASYYKGVGIRNQNCRQIVYNSQPRSGDPKKGGTGLLSRSDGKTYCLDTKQSNFIQFIGCDFRYDEGFRIRENFKSGTLTTKNSCDQFSIDLLNSKIRKLTPIECERLQTVPDNYTNHVSDTQRFRMLGNGWTVDVIAYIYSHLK